MPVPFETPTGEVIVKVAFICNAKLTGIPMSRFVKPTIRGLNMLNEAPSFSFFIEHPSGRRILFDAGVRKDWHNLSPVLVQRIREAGWKADVEKDVGEIMVENGISLQSIDTVIWSHWHWDHIGDISKFPASTNLLTGPGFAKAFLPGYPKNQQSPILESDYSNRSFLEVTTFPMRIGGLPANDFFGDGSLYLLSTPGHAIGHLSALARTTAHSSKEGDTFILIGGDSCHHMGQIRPSVQCPLPCDVPVTTTAHPLSPNDADVVWNLTSYQRGAQVPFMSISDHPNGASAAANPVEAIDSLQRLRSFDADEGNIFFTVAHDKSLLDVVDLFPSFANDWLKKGWGREARWAFLEEITDTNSIKW